MSLDRQPRTYDHIEIHATTVVRIPVEDAGGPIDIVAVHQAAYEAMDGVAEVIVAAATRDGGSVETHHSVDLHNGTGAIVTYHAET